MNKTKINAEIVGHSLSPQGDELISVLCTFPRIILAEVNTHRMLSKNTSSSRAIPFHKMVKAVQENPFVPIAWQKEHKGMQGIEYITDEEKLRRIKEDWLEARDNAIYSATQLNNGFNLKDEEGKYVITKPELRVDRVTKQLCNRLLEPFMWTTMLITGSKEGWDNFFNLRCPAYYYAGNGKSYKSKKELLPILLNDFGESPIDSFWYNINKGQAEIHIMALAECIYDAVNESTPKQLQAGEWHLPFAVEITDLYIKNKGYVPETKVPIEEFVKISTAMAAHTSYTIVGGEAVKSYEKWIELHDKLVAYDPPHSSPMEHCARAMDDYEYQSFVKGTLLPIDEETNCRGTSNTEGWCNNLKGFIPYRYFIDNKIEL